MEKTSLIKSHASAFLLAPDSAGVRALVIYLNTP